MGDKNADNTLNKILHIVDLVSEWAGKIFSFLIYFIIGIMLWSVLTRYFFSISNSYEMVSSAKVFPIYVAMGGAYTLLHKAHVNTDVIYGRFSLRTRSIVDLITAVFFFVFVIMILWFALPDAVKAVERLRPSLALFTPLNWPEQLFVAIGVLLLFLQGLAKFIRDFVIAVTGKQVL